MIIAPHPDFPQLKVIPRDYRRLCIEYAVRLDHPDLLVIDSEAKRNKFLFLTWTRLNPDSLFTKWLREAMYANPKMFDKLDLPSPDTILKDNREIERYGFFSKPKASDNQRLEKALAE